MFLSTFSSDQNNAFTMVHHGLSLSPSSSPSSDSSSQSDDCDSTISDEMERDEFDLCLMPIPATDVLQNIVRQIENYFSDENLIKDEFVVKTIRRSKQGYVNLTWVATLRKIKTITKFHPQPCRLISYAIGMFSNKLELNPEGTKMRRKEPLKPVDDNNKYNRTVIIVGLPEEKADIDLIHRDFSMFGDVQGVRIFDPETVYPSHKKLFQNIDRQSLNIGENQTLCTVEFNFKCDAEKCSKSYRMLIHQDQVWSGIQLFLWNHDNC